MLFHRSCKRCRGCLLSMETGFSKCCDFSDFGPIPLSRPVPCLVNILSSMRYLGEAPSPSNRVYHRQYISCSPSCTAYTKQLLEGTECMPDSTWFHLMNVRIHAESHPPSRHESCQYSLRLFFKCNTCTLPLGAGSRKGRSRKKIGGTYVVREKSLSTFEASM